MIFTTFLQKKHLFYRAIIAISLLIFSGCTPRSYWPEEATEKNFEQVLQEISNLSPRERKTLPTIIIDPGHGGRDPGSRNARVGVTEKHLCLKTAKMLHSCLKRMGYKTILTRSKDEYVSLNKRVRIANSYPNSLFVSIHFNSSLNHEAQGVEVYYFERQKPSPRDYASKKLASYLLQSTVKQCKSHNRGVKIGAFRVIKGTKSPSVLVEAGFLTNPTEVKKIARKRYLEKIATSLARGLVHYEKNMRHKKYLN